MRGILIAALKSGSGKTTITCGLLECLKQRGYAVSAFKCGPDYIDPMFHRKVIGIPSHNLDTFFSDETQIKELYKNGCKNCDMALIEGVMGLFDGLGGIREEGSSYHLAKVLKMPVILVIDAHGMGRTMVSVLAGIKLYDTEGLIKGIILNNTSKSFYSTIAPLIEKELGIPVIGYVPAIKDIKIDSRHLGLKLPEEIQDLKAQLEKLAARLEEGIDVDRVIEIADKVDNYKKCNKNNIIKSADIKSIKEVKSAKRTVKIAVALDEAFNFYYDENLRLMEKYGAEIEYFSPIHDERLPEGISGIVLGGGYPELKAEELSSNFKMKEAIRAAIENRIPSIAECGGFMYLHEIIRTESGDEYPMVGVIKGESDYAGKLVRFGYVDIREKTSYFMEAGQSIKGHEFHYFDSTNNGTGAIATKPVTGRNWTCIHVDKNHWWGYPHLYYPSNPSFVEHFVNECIKYSTMCST